VIDDLATMKIVFRFKLSNSQLGVIARLAAFAKAPAIQ